jgi:ArsR family transcriptional regulator
MYNISTIESGEIMNFENKQMIQMFKALSDETRLSIIKLLSEKETCACTLLESFSITQPTLSYHMKILSDCGLVNARKDGLWMKYTLNCNNLANIEHFFEDLQVAENISV